MWNVGLNWVSPTLRVVTLFVFILAASIAIATRGVYAADGIGRLVPGDQITVTVFGQVDLSGTFQVDGKGFVELPLVGPILVKQLTPQECEKVVATRLADGYLIRPVVSVRIGEVRPVYVVGDVKAAGAYPFRHGSTVLSAIAQAGGYGIDAGGTVSDFLLADERVRTLAITRHGLMIRMARLEAQRDGKLTFTGPLLPAEEQDKMAAEIVENEREALRAQIASLEQELQLHRDQKPRLESAYASIEQQIATEVKQSSLVLSQLQDLEQLSSRGLSMRSREIALQRERAGMESNISRYRSELARLAVTIGEVDIKMNETTTLYRRRVLGELEDVRRKIQEIEAAMPSAKEMRDVRSQQAATSAGVAQSTPNYRIILRRNVDNEMKVLNVSGEAQLEPGDVVEVKRLRPEGIGSGDLSSGSGSAASLGPAQSPTIAILPGVGSATLKDIKPPTAADGRALRSSVAEGSASTADRAR